MRCILLDDELPGLKYLRMLCEQLPDVVVVKAYDNPLKFIREFDAATFDCCVLDIAMPGLSGLEVARLLKGKPVIFVSAFKEYAADAFDLDAVDYIRKPIGKDRLEKAMLKARARLAETEPESGGVPGSRNFLSINTHKGKTLLFYDQLLLITVSAADARDKVAHLESGEEIRLKNVSFQYLSEHLPDHLFCRINKQNILALRAVSHFSHDEITTSILTAGQGPLKFTLSEVYKGAFIRKLER